MLISKKLILISSIASLLGAANMMTSNSAHAYSITFDNGDFEDSTSTVWQDAGSADIRGTYSGVAPTGSRQGVVTTGCPGTIQTGECLDSDGDGQPRNDDFPTSPGTYNLLDGDNLGQDLVSASPEIADLQTSLGLSANSLSVFRTIDGVTYDGTNGNPILTRTPKEGSAIYQDITIAEGGGTTNDIVISFDWDFLTNDGSGDLGGKDFGFFSIAGNGVEEVFVLEESTGNIATLNPGDSDFATNPNTYDSYATEPLSLGVGTYRVGFGVVDADGVSYSSGLLADNFIVEEVPFDFSPVTGLGLVAGIIGFTRIRRRLSHDSDVDN